MYTVATSAAALAGVCAAEGRFDEAEQLYTEALERIVRTGFASVLMEIRRDYGAFLIERGRGAEARALLEQVRACYDSPLVSFELQRTEALRRCAEDQFVVMTQIRNSHHSLLMDLRGCALLYGLALQHWHLGA